MTRSPAFYSLVQYCPDPFRAEAANVGVLLFCPQRRFLDARLSGGADRPNRFFLRGNVDRHALAAAKQAFSNAVRREAEFVREVEDLRAFLGRFGNALQFTPPRAAAVFDPREELDRLFEELVGGRVARRGGSRRSVPELDAVFDKFRESPQVRRDERITLEPFDEEICVPYVYVNGRTNLVRPIVFSGPQRQVFQRSERLFFEGSLISQSSGGDRQQIVVSAGPADGAGDEIDAQLRRWFDAMKHPFVPRREVGEFAQRVEREIVAHAA